MSYNHLEIEKKWQDFWEANDTFHTDTRDFSKPKFYALDMFPYPSGVGLHAGHPEGYTATDIVCRMKKMQGYNVLHPMGFDSFGLPAEQYAIQTGNNPNGFTLKNISESSILYSSLRKLNKAPDFSKIEGKANSKYYYYDAFASFISGFLFVFNNYLPMILCCINLLISLIISLYFSNVDKKEEQEKFTIKDMISETKNILQSNRLKALYLFSFIFTGIVSVSTTLYKAILIDIGIKDEYTTIIVCIVSIFIGVGAKSLFSIEKITRNKTLKFLSIGFILALFIVGILGVTSTLNLFNLSTLLVCLSLMGLVQGAYRVALKKYILSFTTHKIRNRITSAYYIFENIGSALLSFLLGILLNYTSNSIACIIFASVSFIAIILVLYYMRGRIGLRPEQYDPKDINNVKI